MKEKHEQTETHKFFVKHGMNKAKFARNFVECTCLLTVPRHHLYDHLDTKLHTQNDKSNLTRTETLNKLGFVFG